MRKLVCLLGWVCLFSLSAAAQDNSKIDVFGGYSYIHANPDGIPSFNVNGGVGSVALNVNNWLSGVAEIGGYHAGTIASNSVDANSETYMFGPKISFFKTSRFTPFVQSLYGVVHADSAFAGTTGSTTRYAMTVGAGLDWNATHHLAIRLGQADYFLTRFPSTISNIATQSNFRYSGGVVLRF